MSMFLQNIDIDLEPHAFLKKFFLTRTYSKIGVLVDENTEKNCYPLIYEDLPTHSVIKIPSGETYKTLATCMEIWDQFIKEGIDRYSLVLILGGGVLGDMGGFCAATFKRGVDFAFIPTTLLAQVDAGIGGKLGVNFGGYKNQIGAFQQPCATLISPVFLDTLPQRVFRSGFAEIVKHCLISDADQWHAIRKLTWGNHDWKSLITHSIRFKTQIVEEDPYEKGVRKILNFGHTIGHAIEGCLLQDGLLHGEAVAIGMIAESHISFQKKYIDQSALRQITVYVLSMFGKFDIASVDPILEKIQQDKKNKECKIMMTLLKSIGEAEWDIEVHVDEICGSLDYYRSL